MDKTKTMKTIITILKWAAVIGGLIWLFASPTPAQIFTDTIPNRIVDSTKSMPKYIRYYGKWTHMNNVRPDGSFQRGSFPTEAGAYAYYKGWCFGISIDTEQAKHHADYIVEVDGVDVDTVRVQRNNSTRNRTTWFDHHMSYGDHEIRIRSLRADSVFVLNQLILYIDSAPNQIPFYMSGDTVQLPNDTIPGLVVQLPNDTLPGKVVQLPDVILPPLDTLQLPDVILPPLDTIQLPDVILPGDTLCNPCPEPPECPECPDCPTCPDAGSEAKVPLWIKLSMGALAVALIVFLSLYFECKNKKKIGV